MESTPVRMTAREKFLSCNTLVCLLQGLAGHRTTVEFRNEAEVYGTIVHVDGFMNVTLRGATFTDSAGHRARFESFFVHGRQIRYVRIPDQVSPLPVIRQQLTVNQRGGRVGRQEEADSVRRSRRTRKAEAYTRETVRSMNR